MKKTVRLGTLAESDRRQIAAYVAGAYRQRVLQENEQPITGSWYEEEDALLEHVIDWKKHRVRTNYIPRVNPCVGFSIKDPLLQARYLVVITAAVVSRMAIRHGMPESTAFGLSDVYIQKSAETNNLGELEKLVATIGYDFAERVLRQSSQKRYSGYVSRCCDYIAENIQSRIRLGTLAHKVGISREYLCRLFRAETGMTLGSYVLAHKLECAEFLLRSTQYSIQNIALYLSFPSSSRFSAAFKKHYGLSPRAYRCTLPVYPC